MKLCGKRGSAEIFFKNELVQLAITRLGLKPNEAKRATKEELCRKLGIEFFRKPSIRIHEGKVCSDRKTKAFPNRYNKEELIERILALPNNSFSGSELRKKKIMELCGIAGLAFTEIPVVGLRRIPRVVRSPIYKGVNRTEQQEGVEETKESADCILRCRRTPFAHQRRVIEHFQRHRSLIAVHSVGSGKTLTAVLASQCFLDEHPNKKVILISPTSLIGNFQKEMDSFGQLRHRNRYRFYSFQGFYNRYKKRNPPCKDIFLIVDEAHNLRTQHKKTARKEVGKYNKKIAECAQKADKVLLLTATPLINKPGDIASLLDLVKNPSEPGVLAKSIDENQKDEKYIRNITKCKFSFYERDLKSVDSGYPREVSHSIYLPMPDAFLNAYNKVEDAITEDQVVLKTFGKSNIKPFFNGIRRAVNILSELPEDQLVKSPKVKWIITELKERPGKTVIFSHFLDMGLKAIQKRLPKNLRSDYITGKQPKNKRDEIVKKYNNDELDVLFISKAGGEGLDLKKTKRMILMESGWNENTERQVVGRGIRYKSHEDLPKEEQKVDVYHLYHIKPEERKSVEDLMRASRARPKEFDDYMQAYLKDYVYSFKDPETWLSADIMLKKISNDKKEELEHFETLLKKFAIEKTDC